MTTLAALAFVTALLLLIVGQGAGEDDGTQRGFPADRRNRGR